MSFVFCINNIFFCISLVVQRDEVVVCISLCCSLVVIQSGKSRECSESVAN